MFGRVMIATDNAALMGNAIRYVSHIFPEAEYHVFSVVDTKQKTVPMSKLIQTEAHRLATEAVDRAEELLKSQGVKKVAKCIHSGLPSREILHHVTENKIELLLMAESSKSGIQRLQIGKTCRDVLEYVQCPVLILSRPARAEKPRRILNPTTGSRYSENASELAVLLADHFGAELTSLFVGHGDAKGTLEYVELLAEKLDVKFNPVSTKMDPEEAILRYAVNADILVGSRGRGGLKYKLRFLNPEFALGTLEREIIVEAPRPLILVGD